MLVRLWIPITIFAVGITLNPILTTAQQNAAQQKNEKSKNQLQPSPNNDPTSKPTQNAPNSPVTIQGEVRVTSQENADDKAEKAANERKANVTLVIAVIGLLLAIGAWWETRRQANAAQKTLTYTLRPKLVVRNIVVNELEDPDKISTTEPEQNFTGYYKVSNIGGSEAVLIRRNGGFVINMPIGMRRFQDDGDPGSTDNTLIKPGESKDIHFKPSNVFDRFSVKRAIKERELFLVGSIYYRDTAGIEHETAICRQFDPAVKKFIRINDPDMEHAD